MRTVQATEAKDRLAEILHAFERGKGFSITRHGKTIAHLVPVGTIDDTARHEV
ncbi:MAG: type II toxin-antitoxin system Phd/YefM family antitoxin [Pseudomonadota bacterium]